MRPKLLIPGAAVVLLGCAATGLALALGSATKQPAAKPALPPATAKVTRTTLVETKTVSGTLGYGDAAPIRAAQTGTLTWIAQVGSTVKRGEPLFKVDQRPVVVLYGRLPLYRTLRDGVEGADVRQLEQNLADLGRGGFTVDDAYTQATANAVRTWQADLGLPETGTVEPGQVVFTPGAVRIAAHTARAGDTLGGGSAEGRAPVLSYTATTRRVTVQLEVADRPLAVKGRAVTVRVPGLPVVQGTIAQVGTVITAQATTPAVDSAPEGGATVEGTSPAAAEARIELTVTIANQKALGPLDAAPVEVDLASNQREDVLAVPVVALLALPQGGFAVQVVGADATRIVPVKTGMFAAGQVEVSGQGIAEGVKVGVPK